MWTEGEPESGRSPNLHTLDELIQKQIMEAKLPRHLIPTTRLHNSPLYKEIQECELPRNLDPIFDSYTEASDQVQHIRHFQDKMMLDSPNDPINVAFLPFKPERCGIGVVLLHATAFSPQLLRGH